mmetsp:Transcript_31688/g.57730  ORF Transcript_31688/g.57730 Transcript_31688/m.57730 type:complete len:220 (+) Transcript_31688:932-1591(+)
MSSRITPTNSLFSMIPSPFMSMISKGDTISRPAHLPAWTRSMSFALSTSSSFEISPEPSTSNCPKSSSGVQLFFSMTLARSLKKRHAWSSARDISFSGFKKAFPTSSNLYFCLVTTANACCSSQKSISPVSGDASKGMNSSTASAVGPFSKHMNFTPSDSSVALMAPLPSESRKRKISLHFNRRSFIQSLIAQSTEKHSVSFASNSFISFVIQCRRLGI